VRIVSVTIPVWFLLSHTAAAQFPANSCSPLRFAKTTGHRSAWGISVRLTSCFGRLNNMKCPCCLYLEPTYLKLCVLWLSLLSFRGDDIIQVQHYLSHQTTAPQKPQFINIKNALLKVFLRSQARFLASGNAYQKPSSNGLDLSELEPKPVDHRQIPIDPVQGARRCQQWPRNVATQATL
jgi:hypothetical protein